MSNMVRIRNTSLATLSVTLLTGCGLLGGGEPADVPTASVNLSKYQKLAEEKPNAPAGVPVEPNNSTDNLKKLVASRVFPSRPDPFSLLPVEAQFDRDQASARFQQTQGFMTVWTPTEEMEELTVPEPQPSRRLAGVVVSNGAVLILIDMGDGRGIQLARAGSKLGEWTVVSIDTEKAILRRDPKKRPSEVLVPLASPLDLGTPTGGPNVPGAGGRPGGPMGPGMGPMGPMGPGVGGPMGPGMGPGGPVDF
ncbi:MAG: hypothetical protein N2109_11065 [Fimbriimonadales bacterium]|nr:hypothetical protein [Fimbriimonadales bacterium]